MLEKFRSYTQFRSAALLREEREACEGCEAFVCRVTGKIAEEDFVEGRLYYHTSLIERGVFVVQGIDKSVDVFVAVRGPLGACQAFHDVVIGTCPTTGWDVDVDVVVVT